MSQQAPLNRNRLWVSEHSVDRYRIFYPDKIGRDILDAIEAGVEVDWQTVWPFIGRRGQPPMPARYVLHPERTGVFVVACEPETRWDRIVTFLRFYGLQQHLEAVRLWPGGQPVTARATWLTALQEPEEAPLPVSGRTPAIPGPGANGKVHAPVHCNRANLASAVGAATCRAIKATSIRIHDDFFEEIGGFEALDQISDAGGWRWEQDRWVTQIPGGRVEAIPYTKATRYWIRLIHC